MMPTTAGFVPVSPDLVEALQFIVGHEHVITAEAEVETLSKDCYWYSPVLKSRLEAHRASAVVKVTTIDELRAVLALAFRHDLPVTLRGGATGNYGQCIPLCGGLVVEVTGMDRILKSRTASSRPNRVYVSSTSNAPCGSRAGKCAACPRPG